MTPEEAVDRAIEWCACPASQWHGPRPAPLDETAAAVIVQVASGYGRHVTTVVAVVPTISAWKELRSFARYLSWGLQDDWWRAVAHYAATMVPLEADSAAAANRLRSIGIEIAGGSTMINGLTATGIYTHQPLTGRYSYVASDVMRTAKITPRAVGTDYAVYLDGEYVGPVSQDEAERIAELYVRTGERPC